MKTIALAAVLAAASAAHAGILLDYRPASTATTGYSVGSFFHWELYQSFNVADAAGWHLDRVNLSGFLSAGVASGAVIVEIATDTTSAALASSSLVITNTQAGTLAYVGANFDLNLAGNTNYILRLKAGSESPLTDVGIHYGVGGTGVVARNQSGFVRNQPTSIATYFEGSVVPSPAAASVLALGGLFAGRRRR